MVARNFSIQEIPYTHLMQIHDEDDEEVVLEELKPAQRRSSYTPAAYENPTCSSYTNGNLEKNGTRKRKNSRQDIFENESDIGEDTKSSNGQINDECKKRNHSEIEKRRRDKMNTYISELSSIIPMCHAMSRKLDKLTVLRMAVQHLKTIRASVNSYTEGHYKPSFISEEELKHLILEAADGFLFAVGCDRGRILYVSASVSKILNFSQNDLQGQNFFDIIHPKDVAKVKEQLTSSDLVPREKLVDAKTMLPVKTDLPQNVVRLSPGARRSFFCRMKCNNSQVKEEGEIGTETRRNSKHSIDKKYSVIHCTGYVKIWSTSKMSEPETESDDNGSLPCLVAVGRILPHISTIMAMRSKTTDNIQPIEFISRHALDGKFLYVDQRATLVLGYLPQELTGSSMYEYYHPEDIQGIAENHKEALRCGERFLTKIYRFRAKDGDYVRLQSEWKAFRNPWTKEIEALIAKNILISNDAGHTDEYQNLEFPLRPNGKDIETLIENHVEASKIGKQIADQILDAQRRIEGPQNIATNPIIAGFQEHCSDLNAVLPPAPNTVQTINHHSQLESPEASYDLQKAIFAKNSTNSDPNGCPNNLSAVAESGENIAMMEKAVRESIDPTPSDGNDEAAMAVIMSLLEADAGLGGPIDFSGLPWPLP